MGKALKTVGVIIGGAALIATGVGALAMPALAGSTTLFGVSVGTLNTISSGLVAVGGLLDKPKSQGSAQPDEWTSNPDQPIPFLMGRMGIAGKIVQRDEFGPDNMYQGIVGILSGAGPIRGVTGFAGDKQPVTFGANGIAVSSQWQGEMWMVRRSGAQPDTALTVPAGLKSGGSAFEWSPAAKLSGKACYLQVLGENSKGTAFPAGVPDPVHTAEGIYGYDPRYDDTYPGGAGPCRLGVRSTYRWIEDGGIGGLNWALGLVENGQVVGGIGASLDGIDVPAFVEVANIADANNWKLAAWPDTSEDVSAVLDQLLQAAGAVRARHAGKISCVSRGAPRASVATITARDTAGDIELDTAPSLFNRLNTITPRFMSEAAGWVLTPANPVSFAQYVTDDGGKHSDQIDYRFVSNLKQAAELAAYDILDAREPFSGTIPLKPHMRHLKRGDTFLVSEPGFLMDGVKCIVLSRSYDPKTAQVRIGFRSETDSKHALALGKTTTLPEFPVLTPTDPTEVSRPLPGDWTITPRPPSQGGAQQPGFDLTGFVSNSTATAIIVETGPSATGPWTQAYQGPPTVTNIPIDGLQPGATYFIAIQYQRNQNYSEREVFGPFTAPDLIADVMPDAPGLSPIKEAITAANEGMQQIGDAVDGLNQTVYNAQTGLQVRTEQLWDDINDAADGLKVRTAGLDEAINAAGTGLADRTDALFDRLDAPGTGIEARVTDLAQTVEDGDEASVERFQALEAFAAAAPNHCPNGGLANGLEGLSSAHTLIWGVSGTWGPNVAVVPSGDGTYVIEWPAFDAAEGVPYTVSGDTVLFASGGVSYFDLQFRNANGQVVHDGGQSARGPGDFSDSFARRKAMAATATCPIGAGAVTAQARRVFQNVVNPTAMAARRVKVDFGDRPTAWSDETTEWQGASRLIELDEVVQNPTSGLVRRTELLDSQLNTPTTGLSAQVAARLGSAQQTLVDLETNKASSTDFEALESEITTPDTGLLSRMATAEGTLVSLDEGKASASDVEDIQSAIFTPTTGISARLTQVLQTAADLEQEKADVTALQQLEAITGVRENLAINGGLTDGLEGLGGGSGMVLDEDSWGRSVKLATFTGTGTRVIDWPAVDSDPDTIYTISGDAVLFASGGVVYFDLLFLNEAGQVVGDGGQNPRGPGDFSNAPSRRQDMAVAHLSPSTTARMVPRCVFQGVVNPTAMGARLVKVERGGLPATTWSDEASAAYAATRLAELNRVVSTPTTGLASRLAVTESEINTPGTGLKAQQQALTEAFTDLDEGKASVVSVEDLTAQLRTVPNQIANPAAKFGLDRWNGAPAWGVGHSGDVGDYFVCSASGEYYLVSQPFRLSPNTTYTQSFEGDGGSDPGACSAYLDLLGGTEATPGAIVTYGAGAGSFAGVGWFTRKSVTFTTGPDVMWGQYVVKKAATSSYVATTRFMLNVGDKAAAWTDSLSERELRASIQEVRSVAVSADGRSKAIVGNVLDVNGYVSGTASTNDGVQARFEVLADVFGIRSPGGGERTEYRSGRWYIYSPAEATRTVYGKAFGGDQKITWWTGADTIAEGSETKGNAYVYISQNTVGGPRFGGSDVVGPGGTLTATANTGFIGGARTGAGYVNTSNQVTVTVSGGTAGATIRWVRISGDSRIQMNDPTAFNTGAGANIGVGEVITAYFMGAVTKGGQSAVVYVQVDLSDNGT